MNEIHMKTNQEIYDYLAKSLHQPEMFFATKDSLLTSVTLCLHFLGVDTHEHHVYAKFTPRRTHFLSSDDNLLEFVRETIDTNDNLSDKLWVKTIFSFVNRTLSESYKDLNIKLFAVPEDLIQDDKSS
jgi:hypothetical protein